MLLVASLICIVYSKRFLAPVEDLQSNP